MREVFKIKDITKKAYLFLFYFITVISILYKIKTTPATEFNYNLIIFKDFFWSLSSVNLLPHLIIIFIQSLLINSINIKTNIKYIYISSNIFTMKFIPFVFKKGSFDINIILILILISIILLQIKWFKLNLKLSHN